jgi:hypothetical protein
MVEANAVAWQTNKHTNQLIKWRLKTSWQKIFRSSFGEPISFCFPTNPRLEFVNVSFSTKKSN